MAGTTGNEGVTEAVMVRYGEIFLKSEPVMRDFIRALVQNLSRSFAAHGLEARIELHRGRILIFGEDPSRLAGLSSRIFGVVDAAPVLLTGHDPDALAATASRLAKSRLRPGMRFAVRSRRQGVAGFTSQELAARVGAAVGAAVPGAKVDLETPEYEVYVEARDFSGIVYDSRTPGPGGLPLGTQGRVIVLLSAGIDSPVASWLVMKRGCEPVHFHVDAGRYAGAAVRDAAIENHRRLSLWCEGYPVSMVVVPAETLYERMAGLPQDKFRCVLCKRFMFMASSLLASRTGALAIVTGENLGQVASQTLVNMAVISGAATVPVLRPVITFDKHEIVSLARHIGTYVEAPGDLCCRAVPARPATAAAFDAIEKAERHLGPLPLAAEALADAVVITAENGKLTGETDLEAFLGGWKGSC